MANLSILQAREAEVVEEFEFLDQWMDRYEHIIAQGKELPAAQDAIKTDDNLIRGCQSKVWMTAEKREGLVYFTQIPTPSLRADSLHSCCGYATASLPRYWPKRASAFLRTLA